MRALDAIMGTRSPIIDWGHDHLECRWCKATTTFDPDEADEHLLEWLQRHRACQCYAITPIRWEVIYPPQGSRVRRTSIATVGKERGGNWDDGPITAGPEHVVDVKLTYTPETAAKAYNLIRREPLAWGPWDRSWKK